MQKVLATLVIASLVLLSGCTGGLGGLGGDGSEFSEKLPSEDESSDDIISTHTNTLNESGSHTATLTLIQTRSGETRPGETRTVEYEYRVNSEAERYYVTLDRPEGIIKQYTAENTTYVQYKSGSEVPSSEASYQVNTAPYETASGQPLSVEQSYMRFAIFPYNQTYQKTGETTYEGVDVAVYDVDTENAQELFSDKSAEVNSFNGTMYVDENGIVRYVLISYDITTEWENQKASLEFEITDVGSTTVEAPDWISQAESS